MSEEQKQKKRGGCFKWVVIILLVIIAFSACVAALGGGEEGTTAESSNEEATPTASDSTEESTEEETSENEITEEDLPNEEESDANEQTDDEVAEDAESPDTSIGENLEVGNMSYVVNEVYTADQVGPSMFPETANETYVVINLSVTNNGSEAVTVDSNFFKMVIEGNTLDADSAASMSANQNDNGEITNSFFLENLNPGSTLSGNIVFDINESLANNQEKILQVQEGMFGTKTGTISLQ